MHHKSKVRKNRSLFYRERKLKNLSAPKKRGMAIFIMPFGEKLERSLWFATVGKQGL